MLGGVVDTNQFVRPFPRWYTPVKWFIPLGLTFVAVLLTTLMLTGIMPLPAIFSVLDWLPAMYQGMESLGAFILLSSTLFTVGTMSMMAASSLTKLFLFQYVENMATDNLNGSQYLSQLKEVIDTEKEKQRTARQLELENALLNADAENQALTHEIDDLKRGGQSILSTYTSKAKPKPQESHKPDDKPVEANHKAAVTSTRPKVTK
ncbi:hypothetical protein CC99x_006395 [Candidatus Berkiella cookevillensis]|uniref:Uncharacterized protein n=1 Tax=Candidatus Berkiella cookevillensis TaxID=437022 RepID=A0A0Q9YGZ7_9GAMM|nr:hypothetical protein [Candidatus Berkiella cookevillensis]MCS5708536.1 hypothetical protein [Candidatus Berkiella cookevillensis]